MKEQFINLIKVEKKLPLIVAEGLSVKKLSRIRSSGYLTKCFNSLHQIGSVQNAEAFFTFGASFSDNDMHIVESLGMNNCQNFYIGIYGDINSEENLKLVANAEKIKLYRLGKENAVPLTIKYYNSSTAKVWRG